MPVDTLPWVIGFERPWALAALPAVWAFILYVRRPWWRLARRSRPGRRREAAVTGLRLLLTALVVLGLAGLQARRAVREQAVVFLLDGSASASAAVPAGSAWVREAMGERRPGDLAGVVSFGETPRVEDPVGADPAFRQPETAPGRHATDIGAGLRLARALLPASHRRRVVVLSDGRETTGSALDEARRLAAAGVRVDVVALDPGGGPEALLADLRLSQTAYEKERVSAAVTVRSSVDQPGEILLFRDDALVARASVRLQPGETRMVLTLDAGLPGLHVYRAELRAAEDTYAENNRYEAFQKVLGPPETLVVEGSPGEGEGLRRALAAAGAGVRVVGPGGVPSDLAGWSRYQAVFLVNVPSRALGEAAMGQLETYVRDLGHGLVMVGGDRSFGPGGYFDTPVERALPVYMDLRGRARQPTVALVLVLDKSGSMSVMARGGDKMSIAKEAAARAARALTPRDKVGVVAFDQAARWVVPLRPAGDAEALDKAVGSIYPDGGTRIYPALEEAFNALRDAGTDLKHILLLSDGFSNAGDFAALTEEMGRAGITLSSVEVSTCQGQCHLGPAGLMETLADLGKGRFYHTDDAAAVPEIFLKEAMTAARTYIVNRTFSPALVSPGPLARGLRKAPALDGYVATTPKEEAEVILASPDGDPVLAAWQYGLGRAVAWTSDARGRWSGAWLADRSFPRLWGDVLSWLLAGEGSGGLRVRAEPQGGEGRVRLEAPVEGAGSGAFQAVVIGPGGNRREVPLRPVAPGEFEGAFPAADPGAYMVSVQGRGARGETGLVVPYSPEYRQTGADRAFLERLAQAGGGAVLAEPREAFAANLPPVRRVTDLWPLLFTLAAVLLPLDVGNRRMNLWAAFAAGVARARAALAGRRPAPAPGRAEASLKAIGRLRARKAAVRGLAPPPEAPAGGIPGASARPPEPPPRAGRESTAGGGGSGFASRLLEAKRRGRGEDVSP